MSQQNLGEGPLQDVAEIGGGTQNILLRFNFAGVPFVLRRGPRHLRPRSNVAILREARVLSALADTDVPHPRLVAVCDDPTVLGNAVFYLMEPVDGFNAGEVLPPLHAAEPTVRFHMGLSMIDALTKLAAADHVGIGLADFGKPGGFLERQVPRWLSELESYRHFAHYPGCEIPGVEEVATWLQRYQPTVWLPGVMHGDYHAANVMFDDDGPAVVAIVDWEMCTIGDPLLDLGWLLVTWRQADGSSVFDHKLTNVDGLASTGDLIERYAHNTSRDLSNISWYAVLACFKLGIVVEGTWARACAGLANPETGEQLHQAALRLFERALMIIDGGL